MAWFVGGANRLPRLLRLPRVARVLRLLRLVKLLRLIHSADLSSPASRWMPCCNSPLHPQLVRAMRFMFLTFVGSHTIACGWYFWHSYVADDELGGTRSTWWTVYCTRSASITSSLN